MGIAIAGVSERDVDLMLLEEFQSSPKFQQWFASQTIGASFKISGCPRARRSVTQFTGESDLEIDLAADTSAITRLMIENKVNAGLQPLQAQRYIDRGREYVANGECAAFHTVIVAPSRYFGESGGSKGFEYCVTYEQIHDWFQQAIELGDRRYYKLALLSSAIEKGTLGYQPEEDASVTNFWLEYWQLALLRAPKLEMKKPDVKPSGSGFVHFTRPQEFLRGVDIVHKLKFGYVDLHLRGMGQKLNLVREIFSTALETDMAVEQAAKSAAIRIHVPKIRADQDVSNQFNQICIGIDTAERLREWFLRHQATWCSFKADEKCDF
jgi:hypothetical protein